MDTYLYENIVVVMCILVYIGSILFCAVSPFLHERKLKKLELAAELAILSEKVYHKQNLRAEQL